MSKKVVLKGESYSSVARFIRENQIPPNKYIKVLHMLQAGTPAEKIVQEYADIEGLTNTHKKGRGKAVPCVIDGKAFYSKAEACNYYGVKYITVISRQKRHGLSFEEAILFNKDRKAADPWESMNLVPSQSGLDRTTDALFREFEKPGRTIHHLRDAHLQIEAIRFTDDLMAHSLTREIVILANKVTDGIYSIAFAVPELAAARKSINRSGELMAQINILNLKLLGAKIALWNDKVIAFRHVTISKSVPKRLLRYNYQQFLSAAATAQSTLSGHNLVF